MHQVRTLVFYINSNNVAQTKRLFDVSEYITHQPLLGEFATIINETHERFDLCVKGIIDDENTYSLEYFKTIFNYANSNNYRVMFYDQYEAIHLEGFTSSYDTQLSIEDVVASANQVGFDLSQLFYQILPSL